MTIFLIDLEPVSTRYAGQWQKHIPELLRNKNMAVNVISGPTDIPPATTPGAFLNFGGTNIYKAAQVEQISRLFCNGSVVAGDQFVFYDAWHPGIINLKYMSELLNIPVTTHGLWHAGSYDPQDFLGRTIGGKPWVRLAEHSFFHAYDRNYFATNFHIDLFCRNLLGDILLKHQYQIASNKIVRTGWPMEYMTETLAPYQNTPKRDLIVFPHRIAPEKQVEVFRDLAALLPQYEFVVCQDTRLIKRSYHQLLAAAKIVFSANLQETLGISCYEGTILNAIPMVPNRLSYSEMYLDVFKYPSHWTDNSQGNYKNYLGVLSNKIVEYINNYDSYEFNLKRQTALLTERFFSSNNLLANL
jgi:glycosyltransferase involved in cell wall biosynthesis